MIGCDIAKFSTAYGEYMFGLWRLNLRFGQQMAASLSFHARTIAI